MITRTGADPFGRFIHQALRGFEVDDRFVSDVPAYPTPVTFCEIFPPDDFPLYFYRQPKAPDLEIRVDELDFDAIRAADIFWVTGTGLCAEPSREATMAALDARGGHGTTILDLDYRPMFWSSPQEAHERSAPPSARSTSPSAISTSARSPSVSVNPDAAAAALLGCGRLVR